MDITELRDRAKAETVELGSAPSNPHEREMWAAERRDSIVLLARLADHNRELLRRAATGEWVSTDARDLLLAAAQEC